MVAAALDTGYAIAFSIRTIMIRLVIVEDDDTVRDSLSWLLPQEGYVVHDAFASAEEFLFEADRLMPQTDVILLDLELPGMSGIELTREIRNYEDPPEIIILTVFDDRDTLISAFKAGAGGYILKDSPIEDLTRAIGELSRGGAPMSPAIARRMLEEFRPRSGDDEVNLSAREKEVLQSLVHGYTYDEIAQKLFIASGTVQVHIRHIYRKLGVRSRTEAVTKALRKGLVDD